MFCLSLEPAQTEGTTMTEKYTIPGGHDFAEDLKTGHGQAFFAWLAHNGADPELIDPSKSTVITQSDRGWSISASTVIGGAGTWPLDTPTVAVQFWLADQFGVKSTPLDGVKARLDKLADARARQSAAKDEAEELRAEILGILATQNATVGTVDGVPYIAAKKVPQKDKLNRAGLEAEYPTIVARFTGPDTDQTRLEFL